MGNSEFYTRNESIIPFSENTIYQDWMNFDISFYTRDEPIVKVVPKKTAWKPELDIRNYASDEFSIRLN